MAIFLEKSHVSAAEVDEQDTHQIIVIGIAAIVPHNAMADSLMEEISMYVENKGTRAHRVRKLLTHRARDGGRDCR